MGGQLERGLLGDGEQGVVLGGGGEEGALGAVDGAARLVARGAARLRQLDEVQGARVRLWVGQRQKKN